MLPFPSRDEFENWLQVYNEPNDVISEQWSCATCPLCMFLEDVGVTDNAAVWPEEYSLSGVLGERHSLPNWACELVYWLDLVTPRLVTAVDILDIMSLPGFKPEVWASGGRQRMWRPTWVRSAISPS